MLKCSMVLKCVHVESNNQYFAISQNQFLILSHNFSQNNHFLFYGQFMQALSRYLSFSYRKLFLVCNYCWAVYMFEQVGEMPIKGILV